MKRHNIDLEKLAAVVREQRQKKGLTQKRLGELFGLSQTYVGWLELGKARRLDEGNIKNILTFLEIDFRDFIEGEEPEVVREQSQAREVPRETPQESAPVPPVRNEANAEKGEPRQFQSTKEHRPGGKERQRFIEWVREKTTIGIKLNNGEVFEGYIKWWDTYTLKFVSGDKELVISKSSILYYIDAPKKRYGDTGKRFSRPQGGDKGE